jgi:uncharacterized protein with von Willebrand factor type A (vWA) domain
MCDRPLLGILPQYLHLEWPPITSTGVLSKWLTKFFLESSVSEQWMWMDPSSQKAYPYRSSRSVHRTIRVSLGERYEIDLAGPASTLQSRSNELTGVLS